MSSSGPGAQHFLERAKDFLEGMQLLREKDICPNSSALLGIHSAVAYTDALRVGFGEEALAADDHRTAVKSLKRLISERGAAGSGLNQLEALISKKSAVAYGRRRFSGNDYQLIYTQAERFATWANGLGIQLRVEGWKNDA